MKISTNIFLSILQTLFGVIFIIAAWNNIVGLRVGVIMFLFALLLEIISHCYTQVKLNEAKGEDSE